MSEGWNFSGQTTWEPDTEIKKNHIWGLMITGLKSLALLVFLSPAGLSVYTGKPREINFYKYIYLCWKLQAGMVQTETNVSASARCEDSVEFRYAAKE